MPEQLPLLSEGSLINSSPASTSETWCPSDLRCRELEALWEMNSRHAVEQDLLPLTAAL